MREQIQIAAKMYHCQKTAMRFFKHEYKEKVQWYKDVLLAANRKDKTDTLKSVLTICNYDAIKQNGMAIIMFMAAAVDIIENE